MRLRGSWLSTWLGFRQGILRKGSLLLAVLATQAACEADRQRYGKWACHKTRKGNNDLFFVPASCVSLWNAG